jgi:hypothetical protein
VKGKYERSVIWLFCNDNAFNGKWWIYLSCYRDEIWLRSWYMSEIILKINILSFGKLMDGKWINDEIWLSAKWEIKYIDLIIKD